MRRLEFDRSDDLSAPVLVHVDRPRDPVGHEVLVEVAAASVNGTDTGLRRSAGVAALVMRGSRPGFDIAGRVISCGDRVTAFEVGDRVAGLLGHDGGGFADQVVVPQKRLALVPDGISAADAAAVPLAGLTALQALRGRGRLQRGRARRVLVVGAAGGIGSFAVRLATIFGAEVTAVTSADRADYVRSLGAEAVLDRRDLASLRPGAGFDLVLDSPGALRFADIRPVLAPDGVLVSTRPISADVLRLALPRPRSPHGARFAAVTTSASSQDLAYLLRLADEGVLRIPIDLTFPLGEARQAFEHVESGSARGKIVLVM